MKSVPFQIVENAPVKLVVKAADGEVYELSLQHAFASVEDLETPSPLFPGMPSINAISTVIVGIRKLEAPRAAEASTAAEPAAPAILLSDSSKLN